MGNLFIISIFGISKLIILLKLSKILLASLVISVVIPNLSSIISFLKVFKKLVSFNSSSFVINSLHFSAVTSGKFCSSLLEVDSSPFSLPLSCIYCASPSFVSSISVSSVFASLSSIFASPTFAPVSSTIFSASSTFVFFRTPSSPSSPSLSLFGPLPTSKDEKGCKSSSILNVILSSLIDPNKPFKNELGPASIKIFKGDESVLFISFNK